MEQANTQRTECFKGVTGDENAKKAARKVCTTTATELFTAAGVGGTAGEFGKEAKREAGDKVGGEKQVVRDVG